MTTRLSNKYNQLVVSNSGKASNEAIYHVYLWSDGIVTGNLCDGTKVKSHVTPMKVWTYVKGISLLDKAML